MQAGDALDQPSQFLIGDGVFGGVPGLDISATQAVEGLATIVQF